MKKAAILAFLCVISTSSEALSLQGYQATYAIKYDGVTIGKALTQLTIQHNHYKLCTEDTPTLSWLNGHVLECSDGLLKKHAVIPLKYTYHYQYRHTERDVVIQFNWKKHSAMTTVNNGKPWKMTIVNNTQDKLSYQLALRLALLQERHAVRLYSYPVADGGKIKSYQFKIIGALPFKTALGTISAVEVIRLPTAEKENVRLWFAKDLDYLVVKAEQQKHFIDTGSAEIISFNPHISDNVFRE